MYPRKILIVDDSKLMHRVFQVMLEPYSLVHARNGLEGLKQLRRYNDIDFIFLDIRMPVMGGLEFLQEVRKDPWRKATPAVVVASSDADAEATRAIEAGASAFLKKPFFSEDLERIIESLA